jgi:uncharacterized protein (DUF433 family)
MRPAGCDLVQIPWESEHMPPIAADAKIINRGRGPEIAGTRITVYDVMDYYKHGWHRDQTAALFRLSSRDIQAAIDYIESHEEEVEIEYQTILNRHRNYKYPDWVQKIVEQCKDRADLRLKEIRERRAKESPNADDHV